MANYTILLIDYEPRSIERFRDPLVAAGYKVEIATDGVSGIEAFHRLSPDMVLVEAMIPKKHGFEVCQELKRTPHGRRTPVLITTGVYKGRKYRTQALHIYGCDEYIEKPIAPAQLLEVVGKFFGPGAFGSSTRTNEPESVPLDTDVGPGTHDPASEIVKNTPSVEPPAPETRRAKPTSIPLSGAGDDTEGEIMARLDAILPGGGSETPLFAMPAKVAVVEAIEVVEPGEPVEPVEPVEQDPFSQMRAELNAELGAFTAALAFESEFVPSDQAVSPTVLEALPAPEVELPVAPTPPAPPVAVEEPTGQVVSFDQRRPRKKKKPERAVKQQAPQAAPVPPDPEPVAPPQAIEPPMAVPAPVPLMTLPPGTLVESALESATARRGMPVWVWAVAGVVAIAALYVVFSRGSSSPSDTGAAPTTSASTAASAPPEASTPPEPSTPAEVPPQVPASSTADVGGPQLVLNPLKAPAPKKTPDRVPPAPPASGPTKAAVASDPTPAPSVALPTIAEFVGSKPVKSQPAEIEVAKVSPPEAPVVSDLETDVAGVEAVPDPTAAAPATTIAPGSLIPIDEADTIPVALSRRAPVYSTLAKQMRASGTVVMNLLVNERGTVDQVVLVSGAQGGDLNDAAILAAKAWTYRPATKNGVPVKVWKSEQVVFKL